MGTKYTLAINECPHGIRSVSLDDEDGGTRITDGKCCGRWTVVESWPMDYYQLREAGLLFDEAANVAADGDEDE